MKSGRISVPETGEPIQRRARCCIGQDGGLATRTTPIYARCAMKTERRNGVIYAAYGFEIHRRAEGVWLVNRGLWLLGMLMGVLSAGIFLLLGLGAWLVAAAPGAFDPSGVGCLLGGGLLVGLDVRLLGAYRDRRDAPLDRVKNAVVIDVDRGVLRTPRGEPLTGLASTDVVVRIAWLDGSRGLMRNVLVSWPGGRRIAFKTASRQTAREVARVLRADLLRPGSTRVPPRAALARRGMDRLPAMWDTGPNAKGTGSP
jgi:hypothetical protein